MKGNIKFLSLLLLLIFFTCYYNTVSAEPLRIIGFGDSITNGWPYYKYPPGNGAHWGGYQPKLKAKLAVAGYDAVVLNYGWSGESTFSESGYIGGRNRISDVMRTSQPHFVLLQEGTNDLDGWYHPPVYSASLIVNNLSAMIDVIRQFGAVPILGTLTPDSNSFKNITETNQAIRKLAEQKDVVLADHYDQTVHSWFGLSSDGLHPNHAGYQVMADTWFNSILQYLEREESKRINLVPVLHLLLGDL